MDITWRDTQAVHHLICNPPRGWEYLSAALDPLTREGLREVAARWLGGRKPKALLFADAEGQEYLCVRLLDVPHLAVAIYDQLTHPEVS